jgi:hypothetical protein
MGGGVKKEELKRKKGLKTKEGRASDDFGLLKS